MDLPVTYEEAKTLIGTLALTQPRILAMFIVLPLFNSQLVPGLIRFGIAGTLGVFTLIVWAAMIYVGVKSRRKAEPA